jgi:hypothetical protein
MKMLTFALSLALVLAVGCTQKKAQPQADASNPHAGMDMSKNPHAGMDMKNPHGGTDMSGGAGAQASAPIKGGLDLAYMMASLPANWTKAEPTSTMRMAQITIAPEKGDTAAAVLGVFYFPGSGGSSGANIVRWQNQFTGPKGEPGPQVAKTDTMMAGLLTVVTTELSGTQLGSSSMMGEAQDLPHQRMIASVIETPSGNWFVKVTGPEKTVAANSGKVRDFLKRAKLVS